MLALLTHLARLSDAFAGVDNTPDLFVNTSTGLLRVDKSRRVYAAQVAFPLPDGTTSCASVAVKIFNTKTSTPPVVLQRYDAEARLCLRIDHPNCLRTYAYLREPDSETAAVGAPNVHKERLLIMELAGESLKSYVSTRLCRALTIPELIFIARETAQGVAALHASGIIHRNINCNNVLIQLDWSVKVAAFSSAKLMQSGDGVADTVIGQYGYVAPEVVSWCLCVGEGRRG